MDSPTRRLASMIAFVSLCIAGCSGSSGSGAAQAVRVAAAADLRWALKDLLAEFHSGHPDIEVEISFGSSGSLLAQMTNHAPFDLFLSADVSYPRRLIEAGLADRSTEFVYAFGHLVIWVRRESPLDVEKLGLRALLDPSVRKAAIANPRYAPYGRAAEAALKATSIDSETLYDKVKDRLVLGENVAQTAQFVETGAAEVGLIARSLAVSPGLRDQGRFVEVPSASYPRLEQGGVILSAAQDRRAAEALRRFLLSKAAGVILKRNGFALPEE